MNKRFTNITKSHKLKCSPHLFDVNYILIYFQNHINILKIASITNLKNDSVPKKFEFKPTSLEEVKKEVRKLLEKEIFLQMF